MGSSSSKEKNDKYKENHNFNNNVNYNVNNNANANFNYNRKDDIYTIKKGGKDKNERKNEAMGYPYQYPNKNIEIDNPYPNFEKKDNARIPNTKEVPLKVKHEKDDNLELTDYFISNNYDSDSRNKYEKIIQIYNQTLNRINNKQYMNDFGLENNNEKINSDFGLKKAIEKDFTGTKSALLFCSSLSEDDEKIINQLEYDTFLKDEKQYKRLITQKIKSNLKDMMRQHFN
jgi:hypothetical protein